MQRENERLKEKRKMRDAKRSQFLPNPIGKEHVRIPALLSSIHATMAPTPLIATVLVR